MKIYKIKYTIVFFISIIKFDYYSDETSLATLGSLFIANNGGISPS